MKKQKKRVVVGVEFGSVSTQFESEKEAETAEVIEAKTRFSVSKFRAIIAFAVFSLSTIAVGFAGVVGAMDGTFDELQSVWNVNGPFVGVVLAYYFGGSDQNNVGQNDSG